MFLTNNDHLYTTDVLTGALAGNKSWTGIRESFGKTTVQPGATTSYLMRFPGQWEGGVSEIFDNKYREYSSSIGRFIRSDPSLNELLSLYVYSRSSPIKRLDPDGLLSWGLWEHYEQGSGTDVDISDYCDSYMAAINEFLQESDYELQQKIKSFGCRKGVFSLERVKLNYIARIFALGDGFDTYRAVCVAVKDWDCSSTCCVTYRCFHKVGRVDWFRDIRDKDREGIDPMSPEANETGKPFRIIINCKWATDGRNCS